MLPARTRLPPWLMSGGGDNVPAMIAALQADSGVAYWDGRRNVSVIGGEASAWGVEHSDFGVLPDIFAASVAARPAYDGIGLTFNAIDTRMLTVPDPALDILSTGGSLLMLGSIDGPDNRLMLSVRNASGRFLEIGASTNTRVFLNTTGGSTHIDIGPARSATRRAWGAALVAGVELRARVMNLAQVATVAPWATLSEDAHIELGARTGALFVGGVLNAFALLDAPFTPAQMIAWRDFGIADFGISTL